MHVVHATHNHDLDLVIKVVLSMLILHSILRLCQLCDFATLRLCSFATLRLYLQRDRVSGAKPRHQLAKLICENPNRNPKQKDIYNANCKTRAEIFDRRTAIQALFDIASSKCYLRRLGLAFQVIL